jgi:ABC-type multidrug transport system fused ATPase/permease subunit
MILALSVLMLTVMSKDQKIIDTMPIIGIFILTAVRLLPSVNKILTSIQHIKFSYPAVKTLKEEFAKMNVYEDQLHENSKFMKEIEISNLDFSYEKKIIFKNLNFKILKGDKIGIKGQTGLGKTSLINILLGLIDVKNGQIFLDNQIVTNLKLYKKIKIGYVPQSIFLIDDSIKKNISLTGNDRPNNEIEKILNTAGLSELINSLPGKLDTNIGEHAHKISGGQKQRIGIARALFTNPEILILDEATNALDIETEEMILKNIIENSKDLTVIIISHRDSTLKRCNKIFEIENKNLKRMR